MFGQEPGAMGVPTPEDGAEDTEETSLTDSRLSDQDAGGAEPSAEDVAAVDNETGKTE